MGGGRFEVVPGAHAPDLREPIARAAGAAGLLVRELTRRQPTLEQVFMQVIESGSAGAGASGATGKKGVAA